MSNSLWPRGLQHTRLPWPSLPPRVSNSCSLSWWCYLNIPSSASLLYICLQSFPASGSFPLSQHFTSHGQIIRTSTSASVLPMNIHGWFLLGLSGLISLLSKEISRVFSSTTAWKNQFCGAQPSLWLNSNILHDNWKKLTDYTDLCQQWCHHFLICCQGLS